MCCFFIQQWTAKEPTVRPRSEADLFRAGNRPPGPPNPVPSPSDGKVASAYGNGSQFSLSRSAMFVPGRRELLEKEMQGSWTRVSPSHRGSKDSKSPARPSIPRDSWDCPGL